MKPRRTPVTMTFTRNQVLDVARQLYIAADLYDRFLLHDDWDHGVDKAFKNRVLKTKKKMLQVHDMFYRKAFK